MAKPFDFRTARAPYRPARRQEVKGNAHVIKILDRLSREPHMDDYEVASLKSAADYIKSLEAFIQGLEPRKFQEYSVSHGPLNISGLMYHLSSMRIASRNDALVLVTKKTASGLDKEAPRLMHSSDFSIREDAKGVKFVELAIKEA